GNGSHASTLKSPSYTKSVSWQHYQEIGGLIASGFGPILAGIFCTMTESWYPIAIMIMAYSVIGLISALKMPEVKDRDLSALEDAAEDQPRVVRAAQPSRSL
ncbi:hypothetical protein LAV75_18810, partial [Shigella flexneri]|nr:hypothetical protein [Shigella flexneri]